MCYPAVLNRSVNWGRDTGNGSDLGGNETLSQFSSVVEQRFCKPSVVGSNPTTGSIFECRFACLIFRVPDGFRSVNGVLINCSGLEFKLGKLDLIIVAGRGGLDLREGLAQLGLA